MMWSLPVTVDIDGTEYVITNKCDYRMVLDVICALNDNELSEQEKIQCALYIFYEDLTGCGNLEEAVKEMMRIINNGEVDEEQPTEYKPPLMNWQHDFKSIAPPVSRVLGYSVRDVNNYTHWYDFIGAYMEIGECTFSTIVSIRSKRMKGKKLDKWEEEFYRENYKMVNLPLNLSEEDNEFLLSEW